jgi:hypothetical protein
MQTVTLLLVDTIEGEARILEELGQLTKLVGTPVAPVLNQAGLPPRLIRALSNVRCRVRCLRHDDPALGDASQSPVLSPSPRPAAVLASVGVDPDVLRLAAGLCGVQASFLSALPERFAAEGPMPTALLLVNPDHASTEDVASAMALLASKDVYVGVIYTLDPIDSRFAIIKSLVLGPMRGQGTYTILSSHYDPASDAAPGCLQNPSAVEGCREFERKQDLLIVSGHSSPFDGAIGTEAALCARAGTESRLSSGGVYPCFEDGLCFRQPLMRRQPKDRTGLVSMQKAKASFVVLSGCSVAALGKAWFSARHGLAYQCQQNASIASAVTASVSLEALEFDFLFLALMAEGMPLGEVVAEVNRVRVDVHGHATAYEAGVGPFILLGNPCLSVTGFDLQEVTVTGAPVLGLTVDLAALRFDAERGAIVRVRLPHAAKPPFILLHSAPEGVWSRGVWYTRGDTTVLYLWLNTLRQDGRCDGRLEFGYYQDDPSAMFGAAIEHCLSQIPFWAVVLETYRSRWGTANSLPSRIEATAAALPTSVRDLSLKVTALHPCPGILVDERNMGAHIGIAWSRMGEVAQSLLSCLVDITCRFGTLQTSGWEGNFRRLEILGPLDRCLCASPVWGQRYRYPDGGPLERIHYQCGVCGSIGEDDGRRLLRLTHMPRTIEQGAVLTTSAECLAPDTEFVQVYAVAVIESLLKDRRMVGDIVAEVINPGEVKQLMPSVSVPEDLTPGVYPFALLGVVNGASYVLRQMIEVIRPTAVRSPV